MTQEEKELLLKDLCGRLPYGVKCKSPTGYEFELHQMNPNELTHFGKGVVFDFGKTYYIGDIKPYLRLMSSMTDEERDYLNGLEEMGLTTYDFYNEHHLDYRGLIEADLAIEAPEGMYKTE